METKPFYQVIAKKINGEEQSFSAYKNKVVLVVNTASKCGFTPQYQGLQELYEKYAHKGLVILGFPCDQFKNQEPGTEQEIATFCQTNYGVTFPMFSKINVNGKDTHPLYIYLKNTLKGKLGKNIKWNFTKFLISADGTPIKRYGSNLAPASIESDIIIELAK